MLEERGRVMALEAGVAQLCSWAPSAQWLGRGGCNPRDHQHNPGEFLGWVGGLWLLGAALGRDISADCIPAGVITPAHVNKTVGLHRLDSVQNQEIV